METEHSFLSNLMDFLFSASNVRRNETICCLIGFGIGIGCCILYRILTNYFTPISHVKSTKHSKRDILNVQQETLKHEYEDDSQNTPLSDEMTWSEMSSSLSTVNLFQDSYHSNSLTGDSGVDCPELAHDNQPHTDDEHEIFSKKYDTHPVNESHISTEKGLERALEQTSRFYTDLEHIATDLCTLSKRYSQSHRSIDALDWDWQDEDFQSPKQTTHRKQTRSTNKNRIRRRLNHSIEYHESDHDNQSFDCSTSPLRRKHSSIYFGSTDNTSDDEYLGDETLQ